ncbi:MAG: class I SAM-dependent RNA methyltransferase, partial [Rhodobacteraceae bacterium]|nr:class I SAM-dependent RNA methyltransferase [Paracoccaceae bacterium]
DFLADWKQDVVRRALTAQGLETEFLPIAVSPPNSRRRVVFSGRRTKKTTVVGFHGRASSTSFALEECALVVPELLEALPACHEIVRIGGSRKGEVKISVTLCDSGLDIDVLQAKELDRTLRGKLAALAETFDLARLGWNGEIVAARRRAAQHFGKAEVIPPLGAFLQATKQGEAALVEAMRRAVGKSARVADLFAGCGTFALPLAENAEVLAVEGSADMTAALNTGWRFAKGLKTVTAETRDLYRRPLVPLDLRKLDAVVIDPPRAGAKTQMEELAKSAVPIIGAVSCNPVTFARDAKTLTDAGFTLDWVQVIDQFRWSGHVEITAKFSRDAADAALKNKGYIAQQ